MVGSNGAIRESATVGLGVTLISRDAVAAELADGRLVALPVAGTPMHRDWYLVARAAPPPPPSPPPRPAWSPTSSPTAPSTPRNQLMGWVLRRPRGKTHPINEMPGAPAPDC